MTCTEVKVVEERWRVLPFTLLEVKVGRRRKDVPGGGFVWESEGPERPVMPFKLTPLVGERCVSEKFAGWFEAFGRLV